MVANQKLSVYIWTVAAFPMAGFIGLMGLTYFNTWRVYEACQSVKAERQGIVEQRGVSRSEREPVAPENTQVEAAWQQASLSLVFGTLLEIILVLISVYLMTDGVSKKVSQVLSKITASSTEIAVTMEEQERMASQQAVSVHQTTSTIDELGASSSATAQQAETVAGGARQALHLAEGGTLAVGKTLEGMSVLKEKVGAIAEQIVRLSQQTSQIGNIAALVSDLANQTNMLALNAAVEAVRAGEHGKGFAVVASEIRKLADQSRRSTEKINALVADIQMAINSTVMVTDAGTKTVEEGSRIAQETAEAFRGVTAAINEISLSTQQISLSAKQQALAVQQVVDAMNALNQVATETAKSISQVKVGTQKLNEAAHSLKSIS